MKASALLLFAALAAAQTAPQAPPKAPAAKDPPSVVAGIPVNYDESKVGEYKLPDPLVLSNGKKVKSAKDWNTKRRPEILRLFEENQYGRAPGRPSAMTFDVFDKGTPAFEGKALRRQITIRFSADPAAPKAAVLLYLPPKAAGPVPVLLHLGFMANSASVNDPGIAPGEIWGREKKRVPAPKPGGFGRVDPMPFLEQGIAFATVYYGDFDPDFDGGVSLGVRALYLKPGQAAPAPNEWGSIAAWAWGLSRVVDYLETDKAVDARRVAILGVSRLGKTVLWAGARDPRVAMVIASCSGEGGAALGHRIYGETLAHMAARFGYQFCANYAGYANRIREFPIDAHMLISLIAPRPVLLQTGDKDGWSDPKGEYLAAVAAAPVFRLLGAKPFESAAFPEPGKLLPGTLAYYMHAGGHGMIPSDWDLVLNYVKSEMKPAPK
jgi:hypothetical protein